MFDKKLRSSSLKMKAIKMAMLLLLLTMKEVNGQCSSFTFTCHPPSPLTCKPYSNGPSPIWKLKTNCVVERNTTDTQSFEIHWIHRNSNGVEKDLGIPTFNYFDRNVPRFFIGGPRATSTLFKESMVGQYWCQAFFYNGTAIPAYSDAFTVLKPEDYDSQIPVCPDTAVHVESDLCNDKPPSPLIVSTTTSTGADSTTSDCDDQSEPPTPATTDGTIYSHHSSTTSLTLTLSSTDLSVVPSKKQPAMLKESSLPVLHTDHSTQGDTVSTSAPLLTIQTSSSSNSADSSYTTDVHITPTVNITDNETIPEEGSSTILPYHVIYVVAIVILAILSLLILLVVCTNKKIRKSLKKREPPVYVDILETQNALQTIPRGNIRVSNSVHCALDTTEDDDVNYEVIQTDTLDPVTEYSVCNPATHYQVLWASTMDPTPEYSVVDTIKRNNQQ